MNSKAMFRQGDVLIQSIAKIPDGMKLVERELGAPLILAFGEVTGHAHAIKEYHAISHTPDGATIATQRVGYLELGAPANLVHEEHHTITLPAGFYIVTKQIEYPLGAIARLVAD